MTQTLHRLDAKGGVLVAQFAISSFVILDPSSQVFYPILGAVMRSHGGPFRLACLLLTLVFVGAQLHFCADIAGGSGSHVCQVCATAGHAVPVHAAVTQVSLAISRLETPRQHVEIPSLSFSLTSSRAPPSL